MTFEDMWKSLEEKDTTGKYKQAREMAELNMEQLEFAYNSGYADAKSKYERPQGEWIEGQEYNCRSDIISTFTCPFCKHKFFMNYDYCVCGAKMKGGAE